MRTLFRFTGLALALLAFVFISTAAANAPASSTQTLAVGSYIVDLSLSQNPPEVDTPLQVTVIPHNPVLSLQGYITVEPGLGTDGTAQRFQLVSTGSQGALMTTVHIPVRGAWNILVTLNGSQGQNTAQIAVTVAAPGAIPVWLGWLIGASPLALVAFWIWRQHLYRRTLPAASEQ